MILYLLVMNYIELKLNGKVVNKGGGCTRKILMEHGFLSLLVSYYLFELDGGNDSHAVLGVRYFWNEAS